MKLFVLGAGYVGKALLSSLKSSDYELYTSTTKEEKVEELKAYAHHVSVLKGKDKEKLKEILDKCDGVIILVAPKNGANYRETYFETAQHLSSLLEKRERPFYLLYTSSTSVYENIEGKEVTETTILHPQSENARVLVETEELYLNCSNKNITSCILRLGGIYGPQREIEKRAHHLSGKEMEGTGEESTNHIHLEDIVSAIQFCISHRLKGIYNLVNNDHPTREKLYSTLCDALGLPLPTWNPDFPSVKKYVVSNEKIAHAGFRFKHSYLT